MSATVERKVGREWWPIATAPRDGSEVKLLVPYDHGTFTEEQCTTIGNWSDEDKCWRFIGDDGPDDLQPTHWKLF